MKRALAVVFLVAMALASRAQQVADTDFHFKNPKPAYAAGAGPQVCIDEAHHNFHTAEGRYKPFAELLRSDGYRVTGSSAAFSPESLKVCRVLVIANAVGAENAEDWSLPHPSAFAREEINALVPWIHSGGALLLIVDHAPWPGAARDLGAALGVLMVDAYARPGPDPASDWAVFGAVREEQWKEGAKAEGVPFENFRSALAHPGSLAPHAILQGRSAEERVDSVVTFTGHAFYPSSKVQPLLVFAPTAVAQVALDWNFGEASANQGAEFSVGGWLQGAALRLGEGRAVILGEAAMCTAQRAGPEKSPFGMNSPEAPENAQFCLNVVRWLSGLLEPK
ncbi:MAG: hypothetical protein ACRD35_03990 [Candidatus Acidiferrales bacterium]